MRWAWATLGWALGGCAVALQWLTDCVICGEIGAKRRAMRAHAKQMKRRS